MSPPILLLHAFPLDARMWDAQLSVLDRAGHETLAPNLPGRAPENALSRWAERLLQLVPGSFIPVGCSMGGYAIFELWRQASGRIPAAIFVDTRASADTPEARKGREDTIRLLREDGFEAFWRLQEPRLFGPKTPAEVVERAHAIAAEQPIANLIATLQALRDRPDSRETASSMDVPTLVVVGEHDQLTPPEDAKELAGLLPMSRLVVMREAGHLVPLEKPEALAEEIFVFLASPKPLDTGASS